MSDIVCMEDVPFQCQECKSHFPSKNSLKLHCFMEDHLLVNQLANRVCNCGSNVLEPHHCDSCKLIAISVESRQQCARAEEQLYTQSQLWKCTGCGILWKCIDCSLLFKGSRMFKQHMQQCQDVERALQQMKREKLDEEEQLDTKGKIALKEEKPNSASLGNIAVKEEKFNLEIAVKKDPNSDVKEECKPDVKNIVKQELGTSTSEKRSCDIDGTCKRMKKEKCIDDIVEHTSGNTVTLIKREKVNDVEEIEIKGSAANKQSLKQDSNSSDWDEESLPEINETSKREINKTAAISSSNMQVKLKRMGIDDNVEHASGNTVALMIWDKVNNIEEIEIKGSAANKLSLIQKSKCSDWDEESLPDFGYVHSNEIKETDRKEINESERKEINESATSSSNMQVKLKPMGNPLPKRKRAKRGKAVGIIKKEKPRYRRRRRNCKRRCNKKI